MLHSLVPITQHTGHSCKKAVRADTPPSRCSFPSMNHADIAVAMKLSVHIPRPVLHSRPPQQVSPRHDGPRRVPYDIVVMLFAVWQHSLLLLLL
jgi:hypothetical protein